MPAYGCIFPSVPKKGSQTRAELPENGHFLTVPTKLLGVLGEKQSKWPKKGVQNGPFWGSWGWGPGGGLFGERLEKEVSYRGTFVNGQSCSKLTGKRSQK